MRQSVRNKTSWNACSRAWLQGAWLKSHTPVSLGLINCVAFTKLRSLWAIFLFSESCTTTVRRHILVLVHSTNLSCGQMFSTSFHNKALNSFQITRSGSNGLKSKRNSCVQMEKALFPPFSLYFWNQMKLLIIDTYQKKILTSIKFLSSSTPTSFFPFSNHHPFVRPA